MRVEQGVLGRTGSGILSSVLIGFLGAASAIQSISSASAAPSRAEYVEALKLAEMKALRTRALQAPPGLSANALSSNMTRSLLGRPYQVGDWWEVAAWNQENTLARMTGDPEHLNPDRPSGLAGIFRYEVVAVRASEHSRVILSLKVTQQDRLGVGRVDPRIEWLTLTFDDRFVQSAKVYKVAGTDAPVTVSAEGIRSPLTRLELFPLDVPELASAVRESPRALPELPAALQTILQRAATGGFSPDLSRSAWFEVDDFFGRPVQVLWQKGDPWPAYLKTPNGASVLIHKGASE